MYFEFSQDQLNFIDKWVRETLGINKEYKVVTPDKTRMVPVIMIEIEMEGETQVINTGLTLERIEDELITK